MNRVKNSTGGLFFNREASIGIGSLIIFIAMILVAGMAASVLMQTMNTMQQQAMLTGEQTLREVSTGLKVTHVSGYNNGTNITQLALFITPTAGSESIDLLHTIISLSETENQAILSLNSSVFSSSVSDGLFGTLNASTLSPTAYGLMVIRDVDSSCSSTAPNINHDDLVVLLVNTTKCFSGIQTRTDVFGHVIPEHGINGVIRFTTPSSYVDTIIDLQP